MATKNGTGKKRYYSISTSIPVQFAVNVIEQIEAQGWELVQVVHSGMGKIRRKGIMQKSAIVPVCSILACKIGDAEKRPDDPEVSLKK